MNDFDLDSQLRGLPVPEREAEYWDMFPRRVLARAHAAPVRPVQTVWRPHLAWGGGLAFACLMIGLCLSPGGACPLQAVSLATQRARSFHHQFVQLPDLARSLMRIDHGLNSLVEERP